MAEAPPGQHMATLVAQCLCRAERFTSTVPQSSLPLDVVFCHCNSCRHVTGALCTSDVPWSGDADSIGTSSLRRYALFKTMSLLFCGTCSSPMFWEKKSAEDGRVTYGVYSGALKNTGVPDLLRITDHICLEDTIDGGASPWLREVNVDGSWPRLWKARREQSDELPQDWPSPDGLPDVALETQMDKIPVRCRCGGVDLVLTKPSLDFATRARSDLPWYVDPTTNKVLGGLDVCDSCRMSFGSDISHWTFVLLEHLAFAKSGKHGTPDFPKLTDDLKSAVVQEGRDQRWGTLAMYESSSHVQRYFCSQCSATVFYCCDDRPEIVDLAIGLLESSVGARAESLISWNFGGSINHTQDVMGGWREGFVKRAEAAGEKWRLARGYPKNFRRIQREQAAASGAS